MGKTGREKNFLNRALGAPRYFRYWQQQPLRALVSQNGFEILSIDSDDKFIQLIAWNLQ